MPYIRNDDFVGRTKILQELQQQHGFDKLSVPVKPGHRVYLYGLGGVGCVSYSNHALLVLINCSKTQIALAYTHWLQDSNPDISMYWVNASNAEQFRRSFLGIAQKCQIPDHDKPEADILALIKHWLEDEQRGSWLMVIDNADDMTMFFQPSESATSSGMTTTTQQGLASYLPNTAKGVILITTRNKKLGVKLTRGKGHCDVEVDRMQDDEAQALLRQKLPEQDYTLEQLLALASRLEYLPLALVQAAAFMKAQTMSISRYLDQLNRDDKHLVRLLSQSFEPDEPSTSTPIAVTETLVITFEMIEVQHAFAGELLSVMSLFDREGIPEKFLLDYQRRNVAHPITSDSSVADINFECALGTLKAFSLMSEARAGTLSMPRLVQLVTRNWLKRKQKLSFYATQSLLIVSDNYPEGTFENRTTCTAYLPHATTVLSYKDIREDKLVRKSVANLLHRTAEHLSHEGKYRDSEELLEEAIEIRMEVLGDEHHQILESRGNLVLHQWQLGAYEEAKKLAILLVEAMRRVFGEEERLTLTAMNILASIHHSQGNFEEARRLFERIMQTQKRLYGYEYHDTLVTGNNLATVYRDLNLVDESQRLYLSVVAGRKRVSGPKHPMTLLSMSNLASTYCDQKRLDKGEEIIKETRKMQEDLLGEKHPHTLRTASNLAKIWYESGRRQEAVEQMEDCIEGRREALGREHSVTLAAERVSRIWKEDMSKDS